MAAIADSIRWKEILDAAISYRRNSPSQDRLHELVGKVWYRWPPEVQEMMTLRRGAFESNECQDISG